MTSGFFYLGFGICLSFLEGDDFYYVCVSLNTNEIIQEIERKEKYQNQKDYFSIDGLKDTKCMILNYWILVLESDI